MFGFQGNHGAGDGQIGTGQVKIPETSLFLPRVSHLDRIKALQITAGLWLIQSSDKVGFDNLLSVLLFFWRRRFLEVLITNQISVLGDDSGPSA